MDGEVDPERAISSAVRVYARTGHFQGSGFFVGSALVVTCAHVVKDLPDIVVVQWRGQDYAAKVLVRDPTSQGETIQYEYPDLAFLGLPDLDNPVPILDTQPVPFGRSVLIAASSQANPAEQVGDELRDVTVTGKSAGYLTLTGEQIVPGMSGAPIILDGRVRAMVKSGPIDASRAGYALPAAEIKRAMRRHRRTLGEFGSARTPVQRPDPGSRLHQLLVAQVEAAKRFPYQVAQLTHRRPPSLNDVYVEQRTEARYRRASNPRTGAVYEPAVLTPRQMLGRHRNAVVIGDAGGGKSTLLYSLIGDSASWWLGRSGASGSVDAGPPIDRSIPILVSAVDLIGPDQWFPAIARSVGRNLGGLLDVELVADDLQKRPAYGANWLVLIDGLDEIPRREHRRELVGALAHRVAQYGAPTRFVITSRELYADELASLRSELGLGEQGRLGEYSLRPFDSEAVKTFSTKWFAPSADFPARPRADDFLRAIEIGGLAPLVRIPLLATVAAIVYEHGSGQPLPIDRAGLYEQFTDGLLTLRRSGIDPLESIRLRLREFGSAGIAYGDKVFGRRRECLSFVAAKLLTERMPVSEAIKAWVETECPALPEGMTATHVSDIMVDTGLIVPRGGDLAFLHHSFAEYLASLALRSHFRPKEWLRDVRDNGADSLGLFRFAAWVRAGNDPLPVVRDLLPVQRQRAFPYLRDVAAMIEDGGILVGRGQDVVDMTWRAVRRGVTGNNPDPVVGEALRAVYQRGREEDRLGALLADRGEPMIKRIEAARVLINDGSSQERDQAVRELARMAYEERLDDLDRLWALYYLAEYGGHRERPHAVQRMTAMVETAQQVDVRTRAMAFLSQAGETVAASSALARRAMDDRHRIAERSGMFELLITFLVLESDAEIPPDEYAGGLELDDGVWRPPRQRLFGRAPTQRETDFMVFQIEGVITTLARYDLVTADQLIQRFVRDRGITWIRRAGLIRGVRAAGFPEMADDALMSVAYDRGEPASNRVAVLELKRFDNHFLRDDHSFAVLTSWLYDENQPRELRQSALSSIIDDDDDAVVRYANDQRLPVWLRLSAAFRLTTSRTGITQAKVVLGSMAKERASLRDRISMASSRAILVIAEGILNALDHAVGWIGQSKTSTDSASE